MSMERMGTFLGLCHIALAIFAGCTAEPPLTPEQEVHAAFDVDQAIKSTLADMETRLYDLEHGQGDIQQGLREVTRENEHLDRRVDNQEIGDGAMRATVQGLARDVQKLKERDLPDPAPFPPYPAPAAPIFPLDATPSVLVPPAPPAELDPATLEDIHRTLLRLYSDELQPPTPQGLRR